MSNKIVSYCKQCSKEILSTKSNIRKFCSHDCYWKNGNQLKGTYFTKKENRPCLFCNAPVRPPLKTCNRECYDKHRATIIKSRERECIQCNNKFSPDNKDTKYCSYKCRKDNENPLPRNCVNCGNLFSPIRIVNGHVFRPKGNKTCSDYCRREWTKNNKERKIKIGNAFRGDKHPNWSGGSSLLHNGGFRGYNWKEQRNIALIRDNFKCLHCGMTNDDSKIKWNQSLDVDHIVKFHSFTTYQEANHIDNLQTLCKICHKTEENKKESSSMVSVFGNTKKIWKKNIHEVDKSLSNAKLTDFDVMNIKKMFIDGKKDKEVHQKYNIVSLSNITNIRLGKIWKNISPLQE